jgi:hypothetical protein
MLGTLRHLEDRCDLRVGSSEQTRDLLGQGLVGGKAGKLVLPQVEIAPGQPIDVGRVVVVGSHSCTIAQPDDGGVRRRKALLVALRYQR